MQDVKICLKIKDTMWNHTIMPFDLFSQIFVTDVFESRKSVSECPSVTLKPQYGGIHCIDHGNRKQKTKLGKKSENGEKK